MTVEYSKSKMCLLITHKFVRLSMVENEIIGRVSNRKIKI